MTETKFYEPARLSTPPKPLFSLKPLDTTTKYLTVEMTVNKPPSWVKNALKNWPGYSASTFGSTRLMPDDLFCMQNDSFVV